MSKVRKPHKKEVFQPKIGFDESDVKEMSFNFSEFEIEGHPPKSSSFFSDSEKAEDENPVEVLQSVEAVNESHGLNHAFFDENSDSVSIEEPMKVAKELNESAEASQARTKKKPIHKAESEHSEANEIILSESQSPAAQRKKIRDRAKHPRDREKQSRDTMHSQKSEGFEKTSEKHLKEQGKDNEKKKNKENPGKKQACCCYIF